MLIPGPENLSRTRIRTCPCTRSPTRMLFMVDYGESMAVGRSTYPMQNPQPILQPPPPLVQDTAWVTVDTGVHMRLRKIITVQCMVGVRVTVQALHKQFPPPPVPSLHPALPSRIGCWGSPGGFMSLLFCVGTGSPYCCPAPHGHLFMGGPRLFRRNFQCMPPAPFPAVTNPIQP